MIKLLSQLFLTANGWSVRNDIPDDLDKFVLVAAPHTSNWDLPYSLAVAAMLDLDFYWIGKKDIFRPPFGGLMRRLGGISIDRSASHNYVEQLAAAFDTHERMALTIAPEGTRSSRPHWKSGFYHIAAEAGVPIVLGYLDYGNKEAGLGAVIDSSASKSEVMQVVRDFYRDKRGLRPELFEEPRLRQETRT